MGGLETSRHVAPAPARTLPATSSIETRFSRACPGSARGKRRLAAHAVLGPGRGDGQALRAREGERLTNLALGTGPDHSVDRRAIQAAASLTVPPRWLSQPGGASPTTGTIGAPVTGRAWTEQSFTASGGAE